MAPHESPNQVYKGPCSDCHPRASVKCQYEEAMYDAYVRGHHPLQLRVISYCGPRDQYAVGDQHAYNSR